MSEPRRAASPWQAATKATSVPGADLGRVLRESAAELEQLAAYAAYAVTREDVLAIAQRAYGVASPLTFQLDLVLGQRPTVAGARSYAEASRS